MNTPATYDPHRKWEPRNAARPGEGGRMSAMIASLELEWVDPVQQASPLKPTQADALPPGLDAALHYSRRSAEAALDLVRAAALTEPFRAIRHYCLSDDVAGPLAAAGCMIHFVPARPREDDLLAGLR